MQSLLRTRPENLDDLTVQVALVRPGPIQGKAVHPYIEHRQRLREDPDFVSPVDHRAAARAAARRRSASSSSRTRCSTWRSRSPASRVGEAEGLRRAMSRKRSEEALEAYRGRFVEGAAANGVDAATANRVYDKLAGFSGFGFPKSHAAAFGLLAYQSAWLRHHYPAEFLCALLNAQPMGFYPPAEPRPRRAAARGGGAARRTSTAASAAVPRSSEGAVRIGLEYVALARARTTRRRSSPSGKRAGRSRTSPTSPGARRSSGRARGARLAAAPATRSAHGGAICSGSSGSSSAPQSVPGSGGEAKQLTLAARPDRADARAAAT